MAKKFLSILLTLVLVLGLLPAAGAAAVSTSPTFSDMPDNWATEALESAVANGLLVGDDGKIMPDSPLTRAQMATVISRAFGAADEGDISAYTDVTSTDWFAGSMAKAYKMGVMQGYAGKMDPNSNITREQAFAVLARALKLEPASAINKTFEDEGEISDWAKGEVYALVNAGYIQGSNGRLNPQANISRAEFAQMMHNLIKQYIKAEGEYTQVADGNIMVNVPNVTLKNVTITGDLIVGDGVGDGDLILDNVTIKGRLLARGGGVNSIIIIGGSVEGKVIVAKVDGDIRVSVEGGADVEVIVIDDGKDDVIIEGTVRTVEVTAPDVPVIIQNATINKVEVNCEGAADITVAETGSVTNVVVGDNSEGTALNVEGNVTNIETSAPDTVISGTGAVGTVTANEGADNTSVTTPNTVVNNEGASGVTAGGGKEVPEDSSATNNNQGTDVITTPPSGGEPSYVAVSAISVDKATLTLEADGATGTITATVAPAYATNKTVTWTSSDEDVATVAGGVVTPVAAGTATITVTTVDGSKTATTTVIIGDLLVEEPGLIQVAIDAADAGKTIAVAAGTYEEQLVINKPLTLLGPNAGKTGDAEDREAEAIITYPEEIVDTSVLSLLGVSSGNVTVKGFFFKNDKPNQEYKSQDEILFEGENSVFENNRVELHVYKKALKIIGADSAAGTNIGGAVVKGNYIESINSRTNAVYIQGIAATIENNTIISDGVAIQIQPYGNNIGGNVKNNNLSAYRYSIWHNYDMADSGEWIYDGNHLTTREPDSLEVYQESAAPPHLWRGILIQTGSPNIEFKNNTIDGSNAFQDGIFNGEYWSDVIGIQFYSNLNEASAIDIHDNIITDVTIGIQDDTGRADLGQILANNNFPEGFNVLGNQIKMLEDGKIYISNTGVEYETIQAAIDAAVDGDTIQIAAGIYDESVVVLEEKVRSITILGADSATIPTSSDVDGTIITGGMTFGRDSSSSPTIEKSITVKGITFSGGSGLIFKDIRNVTVENNKFIGITAGDGAVTVLDPSPNDRDGVTTISNNYIDGVSGTSLGLGIYVRRPAPTTVIESNHVENTDHNSIQVVGVSAGPNVTIAGNTLINWDQNRDADGGRAIRISFDPVDASTALTVTGNTFTPNDDTDRVDDEYVKITGVHTDAVGNLITQLIDSNTWTDNPDFAVVILVNSMHWGPAAITEDEVTTYYDSIGAAIAAVPTSGTETTVTLLSDVTLADTVLIDSCKNIILDLNGKTISQTKLQTEAYSMIRNDGTLTIMDSESNGKISYTDSGNGGEYVSDAIMNTGTLIVNSGTIESLSNATVATNGYPHAIDNMQGTLTINGGTVSNNTYSAIRIWCDTTGPSDVIINNGTINGAVDLHNTSNNPNIGSLTITDGTFNQTANVNVLRLVNFGNTLTDINATISGGTFNGGIGIAGTIKDPDYRGDVFSISGGTFSSDPTDYLANGYGATQRGGVWVVAEAK